MFTDQTQSYKDSDWYEQPLPNKPRAINSLTSPILPEERPLGANQQAQNCTGQSDNGDGTQ
ncbi:MAG: hypothetical protein OXE56_03125 [Gammaproteobacteria bacterium]|nr:hypothetical protein [Gammaproteobacteria bacterium]